MTGRSERQRRRNIYSHESQNDNRPNANLNSVNSIQNDEIILTDAFKCTPVSYTHL